MTKKVIIVDGNNFLSRGYFISKSTQQNHFRFILTMFANLKKRFIGMKFIFSFDTTKSERRLKLYPEYKGKRKSSFTEEEYLKFKELTNDFIGYIRNYGFITLEGGGYEADDYIACICKMLKPMYEITIISTDKDLFQLINSRVSIFDPIKSIFIKFSDFENVFGIPMKYFVDYRSIVGDVSDNISGINGIGEKISKRYLLEYGNYEDIVRSLSEKKEKVKKLGLIEQSFLDSKELIDRNRQLIDLNFAINDRVLCELVKKSAKDVFVNREKILEILTKNNCSGFFELNKEVKSLY